MENHPGIFIVLEGSDGSGKGTQFRLLKERLQAVGYSVTAFDFPRYDQPSAHFVKKYLSGDYGPADSVNPYTASIFYALDRYEAAADIRQALDRGEVVLSNRFVGSNMAHQGSKFGTEGEQRGFFIWEDSLEYQLLGIPRPNLNIFLHLSAEASQQLIISRAKKEHRKLDEHEKNLDHLKKSVEAYELLCKLFPKDFIMLPCVAEGQIQPISQISNQIWQLIQPLLQNLPKHRPKARTVNLDETKASTEIGGNSDDQPEPTENILRNVNFLTKRTLLCVEDLELKPVISGDGQQKVSIRTNTELMRHVEKEHKEFSEKVENFLSDYQKVLEGSDLSKALRRKAFSDAQASLQPLLYVGDYFVRGDTLAISSAEHLLKARAERSSGKIAEKILDEISPPHESMQPSIQLLQSVPRNELNLLPDILYSGSDLSEEQLRESIESASYEQKSKWLTEIISQSPEEFLSSGAKLATYTIEITASGIAIERLLEAVQWQAAVFQPVSPLSGYPIPELVDELGLSEHYSECMDKSLELYSKLQGQKLYEAAQLVCLRGHYVRFRGQISLDKLFSLIKTDSAHQARDESGMGLLPQILAPLAQTHPLLIEQIMLIALESGRRAKTGAVAKNKHRQSRSRRRPKSNKKRPSQ